jgi:hypothetical protein
MKHANWHMSLSSAIQGTYASARLPKNFARAGSLPACGHHILIRVLDDRGKKPRPWKSSE